MPTALFPVSLPWWSVTGPGSSFGARADAAFINPARLQMGGRAYNLLHLIRQFQVRGEAVQRSMEWLIKRLSKVAPGFLIRPGDGVSRWLPPFLWHTPTQPGWPGGLGLPGS